MHVLLLDRRRGGSVFVSLSMPLSRLLTHGQCDARPTVAFPTTERHRLLTGTKLHCSMTGA